MRIHSLYTALRSLAFALAVLLPFRSDAGVLKLGLRQAMDKHMISVTAVAGTQGYKRLRLSLENKSGSSIQLELESGIRFSPEDSLEQDLVLAGGESAMLAPFGKATQEVYTFCARRDARVPGPDSKFRYAGMSAAPLPDVLAYLRNNRITGDLAQRAVWAVTDGKGLEGVYDPQQEAASDKLIGYLAGITGRPRPDYYRLPVIQNTPGAPATEPRNLHIHALFEEKLEQPKKLTLAIYNDRNEVIQSVFAERMFGKTGHRFRVRFDAGNVAPGIYYIRLTEGTSVLKEQSVEVP